MTSAHPLFAPRLLSTRALASGVRLLRFASWPGFSFTPGQFVVLHFTDDSKTWRAYSLCSPSADAASYFEIAVAIAGEFSERLGALKPGAEGELVARGPFGKWTWNGEGHAVLVSVGAGIAPHRAMALLGKGKVTICYAAQAQGELLFRDEYAAWKQRGIAVNARVGAWTPGEIIAAANDAAAAYYLCGSNKMVQEFKDGLQAAGVAVENIRSEKWGDYAGLI